MTTNEYLKKVLEEQELTTEQVKELNDIGDEVEKLIKEKLSDVSMTIKRAGSKAKHTMNRAKYDLDMVVYVHHDETGAGETLDAIYETVYEVLSTKYMVVKKTSAIRLYSTSGSYLHVDVVPGRFSDSTKTDTWLHRTTGDKKRLKTNLKVHIATIRDSGVVPLIRLIKFWASRFGIVAPTFVLELLCVDVASSVKGKNLENQVIYVLEQFRDHSDDLKVEDPANPNGNDLSEALDGIRFTLQAHSSSALNSISKGDWKTLFGEVKVDSTLSVPRLATVAASIAPSVTSRPWGESS